MKKLLFLIVLSFCISCKKEKKLFTLLKPEETGVTFANTITEKDSVNILDSEFVYNGGGVAVGDLNGDGLDDLYFTGNQVLNKLYLNKGNLKFEDVTEKSHAQKYTSQWSAGVNIVDINLDGKNDIYVCNTMHYKLDSLKNNLFINQGNDANGVPIFKEMAQEYGIDNASHSSNAQFFDYDNDGDLDLFIAVNLIDNQYPNQYFTKISDGSAPTRDVLYKNEWNKELNHPVFKDVSLEAGIVWAGYSHSTIISDFNKDGWLDIYVANDYLSNDLLYINNQNGKFTNRISESFKHQSFSAMGSDIGDINNDGKLDVFTTEMMPYTNKRKKLFVNANNYTTYLFNDQYKYEHQYFRNTLQLNQGINKSNGLPLYSEISLLANVQETDWSWAPLFADFDNDGFKDLYITNGFPKDVTDHDFAVYRKNTLGLVTVQQLYDMIPEIKSPNFLFKNNGDLTFEDVSEKWGLSIPSFSNGAAYADLDNDGDLEIIVNNIDDKVFIFKNNLIETNSGKSNATNFIKINVVGDSLNRMSFGADVTVYCQGKAQSAQVMSARGYLSQSENLVHFGLGTIKMIDSIKVNWSNLKTVTKYKVPVNQVFTIEFKDSRTIHNEKENEETILEEIDLASIGLDYLHPENDFIDFNFQRTIPHKFSQFGPNLTIGDLNNDGLDDIFFGGSSRFKETAYLQNLNGKFIKREYNFKTEHLEKEEDSSILLFDADNDGDNDLYIARGSGQHDSNTSFYKHLICINDGKGNFKVDSTSINLLKCNSSVVKAADFDKDGDLDLFVGGRVKAKAYPFSEKSYILINETKTKDKPIFRDITKQICPEISEIGLVSDALWTDFDNDNQIDLVVAGEWMPITLIKNINGKSFKIQKTDLDTKIGWWNSLLGSDFDNDGDIDYVVGNYGKNLFLKASDSQPIKIYAKDFDGNGMIDPFISSYMRDSTNQKHEYFYHTRDDMVNQLIPLRKKFLTYGEFGSKTADKFFSSDELKNAKIMSANCFESSFIENLGNGNFKMLSLPIQAQFAPVFGMLSNDFNKDGLIDIALVGNDYGMELFQGRADAFNGLILMNKGQNKFEAVELQKSNFIVNEDAKALGRIFLNNHRKLIISTQNRAKIRVFEERQKSSEFIRIPKNNSHAEVQLLNGKKRKVEFYFGNTFLTQESRILEIDKSIKSYKLFE